MNKTEVTGITLEELSATAEWKSLGPNLKRLLALALQTRNLPAFIEEMYPTLDVELKLKIAKTLLLEPNVQAVVNLYSLGVATPPPVVTSDHSPVATADKDPVAPSADVPVVGSGAFSDAVTVN